MGAHLQLKEKNMWLSAIIVVSPILLTLLWVLLSIKIVGPDEMAVRVIFGKPKDFRDSGFCFIPFLPLMDCYLKRYPKQTYNFDYKEREVISQAGEYKGVRYGSQKLKVNAVAYLNFPREMDPTMDTTGTHPLVKIIRSKIPIKDEELKDWTEEAVVAALRVAFGQMTWQQAIEDMVTINKKVEGIFKDVDGALIKAGFRERGIKLVISEIKLPKGVEDVLPQPDRARLIAEASKDVAKAQAVETVGSVIEMMAQSRKKTPDEIRELIEHRPKYQREFLDLAKDLIARRMAIEGKSFVDIRVQGSGGFEQTLLNLFASWQRMPKGGKESTLPSGEEGDSDKTTDGFKGRKQYLSSEERKKIFASK